MSRRFTLLEVMITMAILVIIGSVVGVQIAELIRRSQFEKGVLSLYTTLKAAQVVSCVYRADIALDLVEEKGQVYYQFLTDEPLPKGMLLQERRNLPLVKKILENGKEKKRVHLDLYAGGRICPGSLLSFPFSSEENSPCLSLDLRQGYLTQFSRNSHIKRITGSL